MPSKRYVDEDVYSASITRIRYIYEHFNNIYISFSGGKDSSVLLHLVLKIAKEFDRLPVNVLFIDLEAQYRATIDHVIEMTNMDDNVKMYWICLPLNLRNAVSMYNPQWQCWDPDKKEIWTREIPESKGVISDIGYFDFFEPGMEFEEFVTEFGKWLSNNEPTACLVAIRTDESLNRFRTIMNDKKEMYASLQWSTKITDNLYNFYPIYDWRTEDIWTYVGKNNLEYNKIYDLMYMQGKSIHVMRICQPYGDDQKIGLNLFKELEPESWFRIVQRVSGANYGSLYCGSKFMGYRKALLPEGHTWKSYTGFLLETLPTFEAEWYRKKFIVFIKWWEKHGFPIEDFPDENLPKESKRLLKEDGTYRRRGPSWYRLAKCILRNDRLCKSLSFGQTKGGFNKYMELKKNYSEG